MTENRDRLDAVKFFLKGCAYMAALVALGLAVFVTSIYVMGFQIVPGPSYSKNKSGKKPGIVAEK